MNTSPFPSTLDLQQLALSQPTPIIDASLDDWLTNNDLELFIQHQQLLYSSLDGHRRLERTHSYLQQQMVLLVSEPLTPII
ncbi:hypothetical protein, partial [Neoaquamicrobium sediminum]|uniref:hypothetical protein n=1 Tax=Neoaquamicrobium sediminum TaxID=1849104 RepID=UPI0040363755